MNFTGINLDLQSVMKRTYQNLLYKSSFANFLDRSFMEIARTSTPIIEVIKQLDTPLNKRTDVEIASRLNPSLATYESVKVDLTELRMDYSFRVSPIVMGSGIERALDGQMELKDSQIAYEIDTFGYGKLNSKIKGSQDGSQAYVNGQCTVWSPSTGTEVIELINDLKSKLFDRKVYDNYMLGLASSAYAYLVSALTSILKFETRVGVEGVDMGDVANAYGVSIFQINSNLLKDTNALGFFGNEVATVGDMFFSAFAQYDGNYNGFPGYFVMEGNLYFGADIVRPEAMIKLVESLPSVTAGTFDAGTVDTEYSQTTAFSGTGSVKFEAIGLPEGLSINASTGEVTGTPSTEGTYNVTVYGIDAYGNYSNAKVGTITIAAE